MSDTSLNVNKSHHLYKDASECSPITLIMRKYYKNTASKGDRYTRQKEKAVERYKNSPEVRERHRIYALERRKKLKAEKAELEKISAETLDTDKSEDV